jgi:hypothetical protein
LTTLGGSSFTTDNTALLSLIDKSLHLQQLLVPQKLLGGSLKFTTQCANKTDTPGVNLLRSYGNVDWSRWLNVKGDVQQPEPAP